MNGKLFLPSIILLTGLAAFSCQNPTGQITLHFSFLVDEAPLLLDSAKYRNAAGNHYDVTDVQFFISKIKLMSTSGETVEIVDHQGVHYTDVRMPGTLEWDIADAIPADDYAYITFVFGLEGAQNTTGAFPNPPENNMSWPGPLGGGYHYMKINGHWWDESGNRNPFNLHTGKITGENGFDDNNFTVTLPLPDRCPIVKDCTTHITLQMNINNWFSNPHVFNFNEFGGSIMQNREAQLILKANGHNVFSAK